MNEDVRNSYVNLVNFLLGDGETISLPSYNTLIVLGRCLGFNVRDFMKNVTTTDGYRFHFEDPDTFYDSEDIRLIPDLSLGD